MKTSLFPLTALPVAVDGETQKTLLDYANYIYQSHLGGEDSSKQPAWVTEAAAKIESGELLGTVLTTLIQDITGIGGSDSWQCISGGAAGRQRMGQYQQRNGSH